MSFIQVGPQQWMDAECAKREGRKQYIPPPPPPIKVPSKTAAPPAVPAATRSPRRRSNGRAGKPDGEITVDNIHSDLERSVKAPHAWSITMRAYFKGGGQRTIAAAMNYGFSNEAIHHMLKDGDLARPADRAVATRTMGTADYHEALRRGLI